jgi:hypothetical protein
MTLEEARNLESFKHPCTCGGYNTMNGRNRARPHMSYCEQREEYNEWYDLVGEEFFKKLDKNQDRKEIKRKLGYSRIGLKNI